MVANRELDPGQSHDLPHAALEVTLTGADPRVVQLAALDQAGHETTVMIRKSATEVVITPEPRRLRLVTRPVDSRAFPAGTTLGLTVTTLGASVATEQVLIAQVDVGALPNCELAVVEFAPGRSIITASDTGLVPANPGAPEERFTSGDLFGGERESVALVRPDDTAHPWIRPGRYALRDTSRLSSTAQRNDGTGKAWAVALDGSASITSALPRESLTAVLELACGTLVEWTGNWASEAVLSGVSAVAVADARTDPSALVAALYESVEPASWCYVAATAAELAGRVGPGGVVLLVADGVPGDLPALLDLARQHRQVDFRLLTFGRSRVGLTSDLGDVEWWAEELSGLELAEGVDNFSAVAVQLGPAGEPSLGGSRAAELAARLTSSLAVVR
ncbi:hypothetical protein [Nocardioides sp. URHA0032]|uniref:hypothetical protein n=1 Tax=Nocardioides sp. URHA0032 TaxID=1380388 RepID=UPI00048D151C|nr:hypothetical protein [Nocardioides sp. URHA0032]